MIHHLRVVQHIKGNPMKPSNGLLLNTISKIQQVPQNAQTLIKPERFYSSSGWCRVNVQTLPKMEPIYSVWCSKVNVLPGNAGFSSSRRMNLSKTHSKSLLSLGSSMLSTTHQAFMEYCVFTTLSMSFMLSSFDANVDRISLRNSFRQVLYMCKHSYFNPAATISLALSRRSLRISTGIESTTKLSSRYNWVTRSWSLSKILALRYSSTCLKIVSMTFPFSLVSPSI